ncbi:MAG: M24 family metallopeptidase [Gemmataceae bacterium]|nr:M24 family metallopeptidase [Gemmataceae bacterium]
MIDVPAIQTALQEFECDGWLLYDFRGLNQLAQRLLGLEEKKLSRRWFYLIPARGEPRKLVHAIEPWALDSLPGSRLVYRRWQELEHGVGQLLGGMRRVALEYSPRNANPYVSRVDAGTVELVRACGCEVVSSGDLIQLFEATWDAFQEQTHFEAARLCRAAFDVAFDFVLAQVRQQGAVTESAVQQCILDFFARHELETYSPPIVAAGAHSGDPHFETSPHRDVSIGPETYLLIDLWAKKKQPRAVYADYTRVAYVGQRVPEDIERIFRVVAAARDAGIRLVQDAFAQRRSLQGWEVDAVVRDVIDSAGYGDYFTHRTGHNIGQEVHGNGAHLDGFETREERRLIPRTAFSIEPGIYLPQFGVRSEVNLYIDAHGQVHVTGGEPQQEVHLLRL